jgi:predicted dinucleotide-binding enzyme
VITHYGDALAGKILVDITNPFNDAATGLVTTSGTSVAQLIAVATPESTHVVKALNSIFGHVLAQDKPLDAFFAGGSAEARARVTAFLKGLDTRPPDAGGLAKPYVLEWTGILLMGLARNGAGFDLPPGRRSPLNDRRRCRRRGR